MTSDSDKVTALRAKIARKDRWRRLQIVRLRSLSLKAAGEVMSKDRGSPESVGIGERPSERGKGCGVEYGHVSVMGRRRAMEDSVTVAPPLPFALEEYSFFAVYDGHGGGKVAESCSQWLHTYLGKHIEKAKKLPMEKGFDWEKVMADCFGSMEEEFGKIRSEKREGNGVAEVGSTALAVLVGKEEVVVANCGDSRAVLCRGDVAVPLSSDHKPDRADEKRRIEAAGGNIINWNGWRVQGVLATSRSFGDYSLKPYVISEPEVTITKRTESDDFLILATDGLWDVLCNDIACQVANSCLNGGMRSSAGSTSASEAAATLVELAIAKGSKDNISVIIVQLK